MPIESPPSRRILNNKALREALDLLPLVRGDAHLTEGIQKIRMA